MVAATRAEESSVRSRCGGDSQGVAAFVAHLSAIDVDSVFDVPDKHTHLIKPL